MESVYLETSVIGHLTSRFSRDLEVASHQQITREWWDGDRGNYEVYISGEVIREVASGDSAAAAERLQIIHGIPVLEPRVEVEEIAAEFIKLLQIPPRAAADAIHLAYAVVYELDFIVTWNLKHIANPHVVRKLMEWNRRQVRPMPLIVTPDWLVDRKE